MNAETFSPPIAEKIGNNIPFSVTFTGRFESPVSAKLVNESGSHSKEGTPLSNASYETLEQSFNAFDGQFVITTFFFR
jgi:hypothetical protein